MKNCNLFIKQCYIFVWSVEKSTENKHANIAKTNKGKLTIVSKNYSIKI